MTATNWSLTTSASASRPSLINSHAFTVFSRLSSLFQKFFVICHLLFNLAVGPLLHEQSVANVLPGSFV